MDLSLAMRASGVSLRYVLNTFRRPSETKAFLRDVLQHIDGYPVATGESLANLPLLSLDQILPGVHSRDVPFSHRFEEWALPYGEAYVLAAITGNLRPRTIVEIGTFTGGGTLLMAAQSDPDCSIFTLDLAPDDPRLRLPGLEGASQSVRGSRIGERFRGTKYESRITQLYGSSLSFDFSPYHEKVDLVFIDAVHTYAYVKKDSENAFKMLSKNGTVVWDDCSAATPDVARVLAEFAREVPIYRIAGTRFAIHTRVST